MEKLKSTVPTSLRRQIQESTPADLPSTSSSLLLFFQSLPIFHQIVKDLTDKETALCGKDKKAALELKRKGNECFSKGSYDEALQFYSQALRVAPTDTDDNKKNLVATLYLNRATVLHKMGLLVECLRDCSRALAFSPSYAKAWFRRGKANASLGYYEDAIRDFNLSLEMELSLSGKKQIECELEIMLDRPKMSRKTLERVNDQKSDVPDEPHNELQCVSSPTKGRGMVSLTNIHEASLIHKEEPYAAVILKTCRETHCHFCFNELPADRVPCGSCSMALYCSQQCQVQSGGLEFSRSPGDVIFSNKSDDIKEYISKVTSVVVTGSCSWHIAEHRHECQGVPWAVVLPSEIALAGRILVKCIEQKKHSSASGLMRELASYSSDGGSVQNLCHNYAQLPPECKLEMHIYAIILLCCLQYSFSSEISVSGISTSQLVILLSQIRVNSMAVVRMNALDVKGPLKQYRFSSAFDASMSTMEQVRVGQAVYLSGSLFNHSCQPNIHAYFLSRTLYIRATEFVAAGSQVELSYGPQVGQLDCKARRQFLEERYSFSCQCTSCSRLNLTDLVINAYRCIKSDCVGVVLDSCVTTCEKQKLSSFGGLLNPDVDCYLQVDKLISEGISNMAFNVHGRSHYSHQFEHGYCWSCGSYCDLEASFGKIHDAEIHFRRLQAEIATNKVSSSTLNDALRSTETLKKVLHPYNRRIAEAEDNLARAFCSVGQFQAALGHCKASTQILVKLYGNNHIAIGNELVKLASIQISIGDRTAADSIDQMATIFSQYYGSHVNSVFPYLRCLKIEENK